MNGTTALSEALRERRVVLCVGAGGVGKTTVAAALAVRASAQGRNSLVCTIDPARRLANSLGLSALGNEEQLISEWTLSQAGIPAKAPLHAMMLDMKRSWDDLIHRFVPPEKQAAILENRFYQSLSTRLAGSQEYIAMQKLWELDASRRFSLVVLDTPPTTHALDFLDAPNRILDFLDNEAARWLLTPALLAGKVGLQLFNLGGSFVAKQISKLTGTETLSELANFMLELSSLNGEVKAHAQQVQSLLASDKASFVLVTTPSLERLDEVAHFHSVLRGKGMRVAAVVVNRVHPPLPPGARARAEGLNEPLRSKLLSTLDELGSAAAQDAEGILRLRQETSPTPLVLVPRFERDVHELSSLWKTSRYLVGEETLQES